MPNARATGGTVSRARAPVVRDGTRVVPVYVLSLAGLPARSSTARVSSPPPTTSSSSCNPSATPRTSPRRARTIRTRGDEGNRRARPSPPRNSRGRRLRTPRRGRRRRRRTPRGRRRGKPRASPPPLGSPPRASRHPAAATASGFPFVSSRTTASFARDLRNPPDTSSPASRGRSAGSPRRTSDAARAHDRRVENWLWSVGHHPFGPFTNCTTLSAALADVARRNAVLSRADTALRAVRRGLAETERFADEFLKPPLADVFPFPARTTRGSPGRRCPVRRDAGRAPRTRTDVVGLSVRGSGPRGRSRTAPADDGGGDGTERSNDWKTRSFASETRCTTAT